MELFVVPKSIPIVVGIPINFKARPLPQQPTPPSPDRRSNPASRTSPLISSNSVSGSLRIPPTKAEKHSKKYECFQENPELLLYSWDKLRRLDARGGWPSVCHAAQKS